MYYKSILQQNFIFAIKFITALQNLKTGTSVNPGAVSSGTSPNVGGVFDANHLAGWGIPVICGCGPCGGNLHSDKEYLELFSLNDILELMYQVLSELPF